MSLIEEAKPLSAAEVDLMCLPRVRHTMPRPGVLSFLLSRAGHLRPIRAGS